MLTDKVFQVALLISFATHAAILYQTPSFNVFPFTKGPHKVEVRYLKTSEKNLTPVKLIAPRGAPMHKLPVLSSSQKTAPPPFVDRARISLNKQTPSQLMGESALRQINFVKPVLNKPDIIAVKKKISLPPVDLDRINNPTYVSYYQIVREKIRRMAYQYYVRTEQGEVYLSFIIASDGSLRDVRVVEEKSSPDQYLKNIALKSVSDAALFPVFPPALDYPQLSFNVVISFEIE